MLAVFNDSADLPSTARYCLMSQHGSDHAALYQLLLFLKQRQRLLFGISLSFLWHKFTSEACREAPFQHPLSF
jgi:hypothetical protein